MKSKLVDFPARKGDLVSMSFRDYSGIIVDPKPTMGKCKLAYVTKVGKTGKILEVRLLDGTKIGHKEFFNTFVAAPANNIPKDKLPTDYFNNHYDVRGELIKIMLETETVEQIKERHMEILKERGSL